MAKSKQTSSSVENAEEPNAEVLNRRVFKLTIAYDGTAYNGWQKQTKGHNSICIQQIIEDAASSVFKNPFSFHASGRTDTGVHARAQVAHLKVETHLDIQSIERAINVHLPKDIKIFSIEEMEQNFHSQLDVESKTYRYFILHTPGRDTAFSWPFLRNFCWVVTFPLDYGNMQLALAEITGKHDFKSFQNTGTPLASTTREIYSAKIIQHEHSNFPWMPPLKCNSQLLEISIHGSGFLKQMVRTIVGTIVEVGRGRRSPENLKEVLSSKDRGKAGPTAPPQGLFLDQVNYNSDEASS